MSGRIALVFMPFASQFQPSMALGQIQAQLKAAGLDATTHYFNFELAQRIGIADYETIARLRGIDVQLSEWLFAAEAWDEPVAISERRFLEIARREVASLARGPDDDPGQRLLDFRRHEVPALLDAWADRLLAIPDLGVVAFSCVFFQTLPSLALARRLKTRRPGLKLLFGGPCFHGEMGRELMAKVALIDAVAVGEADAIVVDLFKAVLDGRHPAGLPGVLWRDDDGRVVDGGDVAPVPPDVLEALPDPDYADYFAAMAATGVDREPSVMERVYVPYETSRGCWWGQVQHCTFCGLNPLGMDYRTKSADRALELVRNLRAKWGIPRLFVVDNILPQAYYKTMLPRLKDDPVAREIEMFCEIKTNVTREQVALLAAAGVRHVVPGIESLATNVLKSISKGVTCIQNVYAMKLFAQYGVFPGWNLLIRVPGERAADYDWMTRLIPLLEHLHPPFGGPRKVEIHRFSPYHARQDEFVHRAWPQPWYRGIFPESRFDLRRVAYYFDAEWKNVESDPVYEPVARAVWRWVDAWRELPETPKLAFEPEGAGRRIADTRGGRARTWMLDAEEAAVMALVDDPLPRQNLAARAAERGIAAGRAEAIVAELLGAGLAIEESGKLLALPLQPGAPEPPLRYRRGVFQRIGQEADRADYVRQEEARELLLA